MAQGRLLGAEGRVIAQAVTPELLNAHKNDPGIVFEHAPTRASTRPTVHALIERETIDFGAYAAELTFLTYHAVFRVSGLPAGLPAWQAGPLALLADLDDWHQLDHYTAATVVLDAGLRPVALVLQQHNYLRTWLFGLELAWPADGCVALDVAVRSNELFPHKPGRKTHRMIRFIDPPGLRFLMGLGPTLWAAGFDVTASTREQDYAGGLPGAERRLLPVPGPPRRTAQPARAERSARRGL